MLFDGKNLYKRVPTRLVMHVSLHMIYRWTLHTVLRFQYQGLQSLRTVSTYTEDDFEELGPPAATHLKLLTEKPEPRVKNGLTAKGFSRFSPPGSRQSIFGNFEKSDKPSQTPRLILQERNNLSRQYDDLKNSSKLDSCCSTTHEDITVIDHCDSYFEIVTIRIQGIATESTGHIIHSICKSIGALEGLAKAKDAVDVLFRVNNDTDSQYIVKRLNDTVINDSRWSAYELPKNSSRPSSSNEDARSKMGLQINSGLFNMKRQSDYKRIFLEDLQMLHMGVMHLEGLPTTIIDPSNKE